MSSQYSYEYFNITFPHEYVAHVEVNRPQKLNAWIPVMWENLAKIFNKLSLDSNVRAVLLTGAGDRAFTSGLDVQSNGVLAASSSDVARQSSINRRHILEFQECITAVEKCSKPVIVLLHGICYGLGIDLSAACDIRICASNAKCCVKEVDIGLAADIGTLSRLPKVVGSFSWVKDVCLSARVFDAEEAMRVGYVSKVVQGGRAEGVKVGLEMCSLIAQKSPVAVLGTKELLNWSRERTIDDGLKYTAAWNMGMIQSDDVKVAMLSGLQKIKPKFEKL